MKAMAGFGEVATTSRSIAARVHQGLSPLERTLMPDFERGRLLGPAGFRLATSSFRYYVITPLCTASD
jgi:hypothetical protein